VPDQGVQQILELIVVLHPRPLRPHGPSQTS